jgi:hypothetical protein
MVGDDNDDDDPQEVSYVCEYVGVPTYFLVIYNSSSSSTQASSACTVQTFWPHDLIR